MPRGVITTVITPATSWALTQIDTVKDDWGIDDASDDLFIARAITRCSRAAANFCNRTFAIETVQDLISLRRDPWPRMIREKPELLQLTRWPIVTVTSVTVDGATLTEGTDFLTDQATGQLRRLNSYGDAAAWTGETIVAVYSAGYNLPDQSPVAGAKNLPDDIEDAVSRMVYTRYAERQRDPLVKSEFVDGVGRTEYIVPSADGNLDPGVEDLLDNYRVPVVA